MPALGLSIVMVGASFFAMLAAGILAGGLNLVLLGLIVTTGIAQFIVLCSMTLIVRLEPGRTRRTPVDAATPMAMGYHYEYVQAPDHSTRPPERVAAAAAVAEPPAAALT